MQPWQSLPGRLTAMCLSGPIQGFYFLFFDELRNSCFGCSFALRPVVKKTEDVTVGRNLNSNMTNERKA